MRLLNRSASIFLGFMGAIGTAVAIAELLMVINE
jgi:hypothetical protein